VEAVGQVAQRFGVNKSRFWVKPTSCVALSMFNNARGIFAGNGALRKAVNWALDRQKLAQEASPYAVRPWTHVLSPVMPGAITAKGLQPYGVRANLAKARKIARGHLRNGRIVIAFSGSVSRVRLAVDALVGLGFDRDEIVLRSVPTTEIYDVIGRPGADWDFATGSIGWCTDFPDGASALAGLSRSFPANAKYERQLAAAQQLSGGKRYRAFGKLDVQIMRELAPVAPLWVWNNRYLFSSRVDPRSLVYEPALQNWSITALALD
jgi:ABC-type oligopeptide transport system substrate-binding subunit